MGKLKQNRRFNIIGMSSLGILALLTVALMCPVGQAGADAITNTTRSAEVRAVVNAAVSLSVALTDTAEIDVVPTQAGATGNKVATLTVSTNNAEGYSVYMNSQDGTNAMKNSDSTKTGSIAAVSGAKTLANFDNNTWGYSFGSTVETNSTYKAVPVITEKLTSTSTNTNGDTYQLAFGAKVNTQLPAGTYENTVLVSVIANPNEITSLGDLVYMQDMSGPICASTGKMDATLNKIWVRPGEEVTKQLIDIRDGKRYWVAKMADQNCWMTQNLALTFGTGAGEVTQLTNTTSDLNSKATWTLLPSTDSRLGAPQYASNYAQYGTYTEKEVPAKETSPSQTATRSWNLGEYVLATPSRGQVCSKQEGGTDDADSVLHGSTLDRCKDFQNVAAGWAAGWPAQQGSWVGEGGTTYTGYVAAKKNADGSGGQYDSHYLIGNYYQWNTATAGSGGTLVSTGAETDPSKLVSAQDSICPKNWKLPSAGRNTSTGQPYDLDDSFYRLLRAYGYPATGSYNGNNGNGYTPILNGTTIAGNEINGLTGTNVTLPSGESQDPSHSPMYYVRSGDLTLIYGSLRSAEANGYFWTGTIYANTVFAYYLNLATQNIYSSSHANRYDGFSVRCLAR